jgi:chromosome segregation ATPase
MMSTLNDRIALVLQSEASPDALTSIIDDAQAELEAIHEASAEANKKLRDPFSNSATVAKAQREIDDLTLQVVRLEAAIGHLAEHLEAARAREAEAVRQQRYDEALTERDALAKEVLEIYPEAAAKIVGLLMQMASVDQKVAAANQDLPDGAPWLEPVAHTTQITGGWPLAKSVRLPAIAAVGIPDLVRMHPSQVTIWPAGRQ